MYKYTMRAGLMMELTVQIPDDVAERLRASWLAKLDRGERATMSLGEALHADIIPDERRGVAAAASKGFQVTRTASAFLYEPRQNRMLDLAEAFKRLKQTIRYRPELLKSLLSGIKDRVNPDGDPLMICTD